MRQGPSVACEGAQAVVRLGMMPCPVTLRYLGDPVLHQPCAPLGSLDDLPAGLVDGMAALMDAPGRTAFGLAAPQVGVLLRVALVVVGGVRVVMLNPVVVAQSRETVAMEERCLSLPAFRRTLVRPAAVTVAARDATWTPRTYALDGLDARVCLHELDHLDGRLISDGVPEDDLLGVQWLIEDLTASRTAP